MRRVVLLLAVLLVGVRPSSLASSTEDPPGSCGVCLGRGTLPCPEHSAAEVALEGAVDQCTHAAKCRRCSGTLLLDCDDCKTGDAKLAQSVAAKQKWVASLKPHHDVIGRPVLVARSAHFEVTWEGGKSVVGRKVISEHEALHLYVQRCEAIHADFMKTFGCTESDFSTLFRVMIWGRHKDHQKAAIEYCKQPNPNTSVKTVGAVGIFSIFLDPNEIDPDENAGAELHRAVLHNVSHLLLANVWNALSPDEKQGGWIHEGVAHWFEDRLDRRCTNFCYQEQDTQHSFKGGRWREPVKKLAGSAQRPPFAETAGKRTDELTLEEHALAWSYCEFLIHTNGIAFGKICRAIKEGKGYRDSLKEGFGWNALSFEEAWKKHVRKYAK